MKKGIHTYSWSLKDLLQNGLPPFSIVASSDGRLYEIRKNELGTIVVPARFLHRLEEVPTGFQLGLPKISGYLLEQTLTFFRDFCRNGLDHEVMVQLYWNKRRMDYEVYCPKQSVSKVNVYYDEREFSEDRIEVLQIHSHNTMPAYFSPTDNRDEKKFLLFGVAGNLDKTPSLGFRVGLNGFYYDLDVNHIFEDFNPNKHCDYPDSWKDNIQLITSF
jgi:PRTRC genetic system protein A